MDTGIADDTKPHALILEHDEPSEEARSCTCHPSESPVPCERKYAFSECVAAAAERPGGVMADDVVMDLNEWLAIPQIDSCEPILIEFRNGCETCAAAIRALKEKGDE